jgi:hypothetical protein
MQQSPSPVVAPPAHSLPAVPFARTQSVNPSQNPPRATSGQATPSASPRVPDYVEEKGFKGRVFEIRHREPDAIAMAVRPLASGFKGATMSPNREFKILTVRDFPENIAAIEEALKRLDVPELPGSELEFLVHILIATAGSAPLGDYPADLAPVVKQLQGTLKYKNYGLLASTIVRGKEGVNAISNSGIAESKLLGITTPEGNPVFYNYQLGRISIEGPPGSPTIQIGDFRFGMRAPLVVGVGGAIQYENIGFNTPVAVRTVEKVVVGTTSMGDKGLIVVLSTKILKKTDPAK